MLENENYPANKKRLLPRMAILIPAVLIFVLAYLFYFNPTFLSNNLKKNLSSNNNPNKSLAIQNETDSNSLIGGGVLTKSPLAK